MSFDSPAADSGGRRDSRHAPAASDLATMLARDQLDATHAYVVALDRVLARAHDGGIETARRQLEAIPPPAGVATAHLLERKRRELDERFHRARYQHLYLPGASLDAWLRFFFTAAEMAGSDTVTLDGVPGATLAPEREVPVAAGSGLRARVRAAGQTLADVRELSFMSPHGDQHAALDAAAECLSLGAVPWLYQQLMRELDDITGEAPLDLSLSYDAGREVQEGTTLSVRLALKNISRDVLVLEKLATDHPYDPHEVFSHASLGRLVHDPATDRYAYDAVANGMTASAFRTAVLGPGQERVVILTIKLLEGGECWRRFSVDYQRLTPEEFRHQAYVPVPGPTHEFPPRVMYGPVAGLADPDKADLTTVVLRPCEASTRTQSWLYAFHVGRRAFSLAQARSRLAGSGEPVHYSRWQQAWVMRVPEGCALVSPSRITLYPRMDPRAFIVIDEAEQRVPIRFAGALLPCFRSLPLGVTDWESHALGLPVSLPKLKLTSFFQEVERIGAAIGLEENVLGRQSLLVSP